MSRHADDCTGAGADHFALSRSSRPGKGADRSRIGRPTLRRSVTLAGYHRDSRALETPYDVLVVPQEEPLVVTLHAIDAPGPTRPAGDRNVGRGNSCRVFSMTLCGDLDGLVASV